jgi:plasmid rolling circle replication initiator protein Rep
LPKIIPNADLHVHPSLESLSPRDKPWDTHRTNSVLVHDHYKSSSLHQKQANRMSVCSLLLEFRLLPVEEAAIKLKLSNARFCRVRWCPVCQWRRSLQWKAKTIKIMPAVLEAYPTYRWLFLTLTVKNCDVTDLRSTMQHLNKSFERLSKLKTFPGEGWIRGAEVTRGKDGSAHPHFHVLMMVKPIYFSQNYLSIAKWKEMWQKSLRVDYLPQVDVKAVKAVKPEGDIFDAGKGGLADALSEIVKYQVKEADLTNDREWFLTMSDQLHRTRAISVAGILKDYLKEIEKEPDDLIGEGDEEEEQSLGELYFAWMEYYKQYRKVEI